MENYTVYNLGKKIKNNYKDEQTGRLTRPRASLPDLPAPDHGTECDGVFHSLTSHVRLEYPRAIMSSSRKARGLTPQLIKNSTGI